MPPKLSFCSAVVSLTAVKVKLALRAAPEPPVKVMVGCLVSASVLSKSAQDTPPAALPAVSVKSAPRPPSAAVKGQPTLKSSGTGSFSPAARARLSVTVNVLEPPFSGMSPPVALRLTTVASSSSTVTAADLAEASRS